MSNTELQIQWIDLSINAGCTGKSMAFICKLLCCLVCEKEFVLEYGYEYIQLFYVCILALWPYIITFTYLKR